MADDGTDDSGIDPSATPDDSGGDGSGGGLLGGVGSDLSGAASGLGGDASSALGSATGALGGLGSGGLGSLGSAASGALGGLGSQAQGALGGLAQQGLGAAGSALGGLAGQAASALGPALGGVPAAALPPRVPIMSGPSMVSAPAAPSVDVNAIWAESHAAAASAAAFAATPHRGHLHRSIPLAALGKPSITLAHAHQIVAQRGSSAHAARFISRTLKSAATGHPTGIANAEVLSLAQRLQIQAAYVGKYLGMSQAKAIAQGLHMTSPMQVPIGAGLYDAALPLYLEQTVTAMKNTNRDPAQLRQLAAALYTPTR